MLDVDLATGRIRRTERDPGEWADRPGGALIALDLIAEAEAAGAIGDDAPVVLAGGVVAGFRFPGLARAGAVGRSPLTGGVVDARIEGHFPAALRDCGLTAISVRGRASAPCYLLVTPDGARIADARELWGRTTGQATELLRRRHGRAARVAAIGPAGEHRVAFADIVCDGGFAAARGGLGARWGAKRLKAVVVLPGEPAEPFDPERLGALGHRFRAALPGSVLATGQRRPPGFGAWMGTAAAEGYGVVENYRTSRLPAPNPLAARAFLAALRWDGGACPGCPVDCVKGFGTEGHGPGGSALALHQEAVAALGPNLGVYDLPEILRANAACHRLGLDPVSAGLTLGWACEVAEHGIALAPDAPRFGQPHRLGRWLGRIAHREGLGDLLADGVAAAARQTRPDLAMQAGGMELSTFDPRRLPGLAVAWAASPLGIRYDAAEHDIDFDPAEGLPDAAARLAELGLEPLPGAELSPRKARRTARLLELWSGLEALGVCVFAGPPTRVLSVADVCEVLAAAGGLDADAQRILHWGRERLARARRLHPDPDAAELPDRFFTEPIDAGPAAGAVLDRARFAQARAELARALGWAEGSDPVSSV
ncbi:aldehyde ferredoxin oxidoreductase C-terminal domain-containing protein [Dactylosporangium salmoneum]|uniref:Aldehyde ferredoxin oxidoreductase N-terminal domain-containing protein n=1 Tax=Dactylosporangium salmoneum TaxID=53361 RepID=A0ABP5UTU1_9ACTN